MAVCRKQAALFGAMRPDGITASSMIHKNPNTTICVKQIIAPQRR
jgi:hypothetical protein